MKKIIALILALTSPFALCACGGKNNQGSDANLSLVDKDGKARFTILTNSNLDSTVKSAALLLSSELRKNIGGIFRVTGTASAKEDKNAYEILIGDTGREESVALSEGIAEKEYRIKVMGRKIVVVGGSNVAVTRGIGKLISIIDYEKKSVPKSLNISEVIGGGGSLLVGMANQKSECGESGRAGGYIDIYDISTGDMNTPIKSYKPNTSAISGFKFRNSAKYGEVLVTTGAYDGAILSMETGELLWKTSEAAQNSHSIELLPNGVIATASSAGNALHFFDANGTDTSCKAKLALPDAHGVLWDPKYNVLWATGRNNLWALEVTLGDDGSITVTKNEELSATLPINNAHDLQPYYGNKDYILVTGSAILVYNKVTKTFVELPRDEDGRTVTGISVLPNGDIVYIYPDRLMERWCSTWLNRIDAATGEIIQIHSNQGRFYKVRVLNYDYQ